MNSRAIRIILSTIILMLAFSFCAYAEKWEKVSDGCYEVYGGAIAEGIAMRGIDVSKWQEDIDWSKVAKDDVSFAMMRIRANGELDTRFLEYAKGATSNGIRMGVYLYMNALTVEQSEADAQWVLNVIKDYPVSMPVALDVEDEDYYWNMSNDELYAIVSAFCTKIQEAGYTPIVYINDYWARNKLDMAAFKNWKIWVAKYAGTPSTTTHTMWQTTASGRINGISKNVDIDYFYGDINSICPPDGFRYFDGKKYYYRNYSMVKDDWVQDNGSWYYAGQDGVLLTGWQQVKDSWYLLGSDGKMLTGFVTDNGKQYYLDESGALVTGIKEIAGALYDFASDGGLVTSGQIEFNGKTYDINADGHLSEYIPPETEAVQETEPPKGPGSGE